MAKVAPELQYSDEHEWVARDTGNAGSNIVSIGISAVAADALGDIVYVDLPEVGSTVTAGETCGEVESTKSVSDLYAPVTGEVVEINGDVVSDPALINSDPYGAGWLFKVAVTEEGPLLSAEEYAAKNGGEL
ncbi:glycine cleavage system protein GcvH [Arthrobacter pascens]|uniref:glycine cleavage system protein GcvH n=2 Tax=Arthrobacter pascens TaxID=1677 RepID=UPI0031D444A7